MAGKAFVTCKDVHEHVRSQERLQVGLRILMRIREAKGIILLSPSNSYLRPPPLSYPSRISKGW